MAIVNESVARYYFGDENPIGRRISSIDGETGSYDIVGVVADAKYETLHEPAPRTIYLNAFQHGSTFSHFAIRTAGNPVSIAGQVRRTMHDHLTPVRVANVTTLVSQMDASLVPERVMTTLSGFFAVLSVLLASVGLYGLLAYTITRRTGEIGVRMALGATRGTIGAMVLRSALGPTVLGLTAGIALSLWGKRVAGTVVERLPGDSAPVIVATLLMLGVAAVAAAVPAIRAARVRPTEALRCE